jgi:aspartokinase/homoserine dehydrogenase 1
VGENMKNHQDQRKNGTLGKNNVNIRAIAQGALSCISAVINERDVKSLEHTS